MFRLTAPAWLAGMVALTVPVVLHLWSRRPSRVVRLGSLSGLAGPPGAPALGRRLEEIPLLLLRCGVLALTILGIAGPTVSRSADSRPAARVVLVLPSALPDSLGVYTHPVADSLRRAGEPLRLAAVGFPALGAGQTPVSAGTGPRLWPLLATLADTLPPGSRITVLGSPSAAELGPVRPAVGTVVEFLDLGDGMWTVEPGEEGWSSAIPLLADRPGTGSALYVVASSEFDGEARVAEAAWSAALEGVTGVEPTVTRGLDGTLTHDSVTTKVVLWLTGQSVSSEVLNTIAGGLILVEFPASGGEVAGAGFATPVATARVAVGTLRQPIHRIRPDTPGTPLLVDAAGRPVLTVEPMGSGLHYRMGTRLLPAWSELAQGADLPELALMTLRGAQTGVGAAPVAPSQAGLASAAPSSPGTRGDWGSLAPLAWALAALLLVVERWIAHRRASGGERAA